MSNEPLLAITMGDPAGIGPEIVVRALAREDIQRLCRPVVIGDARLLEVACDITGVGLKVNRLRSVDNSQLNKDAINVVDLHNVDCEGLVVGQVSKMCGKAALEYILTSIDLARRHLVEAVVTGPIHKEAIALAGCPHPGHTEIFATSTGTRDYAMMLIVGELRVSHVTTHIPLAQVASHIRKERVLRVIELTHEAMLSLGIANPRIAVAALNPHASDGGLFGEEEAKEIEPAVECARSNNIRADGPIPPDTVFVKHASHEYDAVVAMYHDQGHIPLKLVGFRWDNEIGDFQSVSGVNVTLGLPIIRTSVDHGVAFDKAGTGCARAESLCEAIELAVTMCSRGPRANLV